MTAVYAPLQNASAAQRGAITTVAQEIAGAKHFLDPLTAEELVAQWLSLQNSYSEAFVVETLPFTANGVPLSFGGQTQDAAPFWGIRAQSIPGLGEAGTLTTMGLGLFPGDGPADLVGIDTMPAVRPGLMLSTSTAGTSAALIATDTYVGLTAGAVNAALAFNEGTGYLRVPLSVDFADAALRSGSLAFRFSNGTSNIAQLRHASNTVPPTLGNGVEWLLEDGSGPVALTRGLTGLFAQGLVLGPILDLDLGALAGGVHLVSEYNEEEPIVTLGFREAGDFVSAARVHFTGAYEIERATMGAADGGTLMTTGAYGQQRSHSTTRASGSLTAPTTNNVESITIYSPAILATSVPRVEVIGQPITSGKGTRPIAIIETVAAGEFRFTFRELEYPEYQTAWAPGGTGSIRWEVSR